MPKTVKQSKSAEPQRAKLTKRAVDAAKPGPARYVVWDTEIKGFGLRVFPSSQKSYVFKYDVDGKDRWHTIGVHGPWTPDGAREEAHKLASKVRQGGNPQADKQRAKAMPTVAELADAFLAERVGRKKASTVTADRGRIENHIKPLLGDVKVDKLTEADVDRLFAAVRDGGTAGRKDGARPKGRIVVKGGEGAAKQCVMLLSTLMSAAIRKKHRTDNPAKGFDKPKGKTMERFLSDEEIGRLGEALAAEVDATCDPYPAAAIALLVFTGCRRGEIEKLEWGFVDFARRQLHLPDSKTGKKTVYLNAPALVLLEELASFAGTNRYVIQGRVTGKHFQGWGKVWDRIRRRAGLEGVRLHDLRHSFASASARGGYNLPMIGALLGHKHAATTQRYVHLVNAPVHEASEKIGSELATAMSGAGGAVIPFKLPRPALAKRA